MSAPPCGPSDALAEARSDLVDLRRRAVQSARRVDLAIRSRAPLHRLRELDTERLARKREVAELERRVRDLEAELASPRQAVG